jgi:molybdopterin synthase sulfur carrier subunit
VNLLYFAWVRQKIGKTEERIELPVNVASVRALAEYLRGRGAGYEEVFSDLARLRVAVNQEHVSFDASLAANDEVAFFPPVTGG